MTRAQQDVVITWLCGLIPAGVLWLAVTVLTGCAYHMNPLTIEMMEDETCLQEWATGDYETDMATVHDLADWYGVRIEQGNLSATKAAPGLILLSAEHDEQDDLRKVQSFAHEFTHICQGHAYGWGYMATGLGPLGLAAIETPAKRSEWETMLLQGYEPESVERQIEREIPKFVERYDLGDIVGIEAELARVWRVRR